MYLLDTDVLIDIQRAYVPALTWFATLTELPAVPSLVVMELIQDAQNARQVRQALKLVPPLPVVWPTAADCQRALTDFIAYHLSHNLGLLDALIAACADWLVGNSVYLQRQALPGGAWPRHGPALHPVSLLCGVEEEGILCSRPGLTHALRGAVKVFLILFRTNLPGCAGVVRCGV